MTSEPNYLDICRVCGFTRGNHRWRDQACPGGKRVRRGRWTGARSAWRHSKFHWLRGRRARPEW